MKLTEEQWQFIEPMLPKQKVRKDRRGRRWKDPRDVLEGILWVLKSGARWKDLPDRNPPYQTCHRRFQHWVKDGTFRKILTALVEHLRKKAKDSRLKNFTKIQKTMASGEIFRVDSTFSKSRNSLWVQRWKLFGYGATSFNHYMFEAFMRPVLVKKSEGWIDWWRNR